jgi:hypothetical protein
MNEEQTQVEERSAAATDPGQEGASTVANSAESAGSLKAASGGHSFSLGRMLVEAGLLSTQDLVKTQEAARRGSGKPTSSENLAWMRLLYLFEFFPWDFTVLTMVLLCFTRVKSQRGRG